MKNRKHRSSLLPKGFQSLWNELAPRPASTPRPDDAPKSQTPKPVVVVAPAKAQPVAPHCPRVGDKREVAYPPFLMAFDRQNEGHAPVEARARQAPLDKAPLDKAPLDKAPLDKAPLDKAPLDKAPRR